MVQDLPLKTPMPQKAAVVELPSRYKQTCWFCKSILSNLPLCSKCKKIQEFPEARNYFETLNVAVSLNLDSEQLAEHFYCLSKQVHPDKFVQATPIEIALSLNWTTQLNRAYQTLRDRLARSRYILEIFSVHSDIKSTQPPLELAQEYFEHQELVESGALSNLNQFATSLRNRLNENRLEWAGIAADWLNSTEMGPLLKRLEKNLVKEKFLESMLNDLTNKTGKIA